MYVCISTGSTALYLSRQLIAGNMAQCTLALGFEKMQVYDHVIPLHIIYNYD